VENLRRRRGEYQFGQQLPLPIQSRDREVVIRRTLENNERESELELLPSLLRLLE
jgi:hypothetical protein